MRRHSTERVPNPRDNTTSGLTTTVAGSHSSIFSGATLTLYGHRDAGHSLPGARPARTANLCCIGFTFIHSATERRLTMFEQAFKNIDDVLWKEAGCTTELDYTEQTSWLLFLKYLDGLEQDKAMEAELQGKKYAFILDKPYQWESWAAPKGRDGKLDHNKALSGDDLRDFVNLKLFPYLHGFRQRASGSNTIEYKIGEIFAEIKNKIQSGL